MISQKIKELRKKSGLTQSDLSEQLNKNFGIKTDRATVSNWERGASIPVTSTLQCLAKLFNVSLDYLTSNVDSEEEKKKKIKAALFSGSTTVTDEMLDELMKFAQYIEKREADKNENN